MATMYEIIDSLCKEHGTNVTAMCKKLNIARSSLSELSRGRSKTLSADKIVKISKYFNVDPDFLLGKTDVRQKTPAESGERTVSDEDIRFALFNGADDITDEMFEEVKRFAQFIQERERKKSD